MLFACLRASTCRLAADPVEDHAAPEARAVLVAPAAGRAGRQDLVALLSEAPTGLGLMAVAR